MTIHTDASIPAAPDAAQAYRRALDQWLRQLPPARSEVERATRTVAFRAMYLSRRS